LFEYIRRSDAVHHLFKYQKIDELLKYYDESLKTNPYWFWYQQVKANQVINLLTVVVWWDMFIAKKRNVLTINELV